ncbi:hypothetical protein [Ekhidna sp.]|uniref:hypothetical protein n=1 Tax=Ekhidna sp. TaxID=2608089 RepID=UPI003C7D74FD
MLKARLLLFLLPILIFGCDNNDTSVTNGFTFEGEFIETPFADVENQGPYFTNDQFRVTLTLSSKAFSLGEQIEKVDFIYLVLLTDELGKIPDGQYSLSKGNLLNVIIGKEYSKNETGEDAEVVWSNFTEAIINIKKSFMTNIEFTFHSPDLLDEEVSGSFLGTVSSNDRFVNGQVSLNDASIAPNYSLSSGFIQKGEFNGKPVFTLTLSNKNFTPDYNGSFTSINFITLNIEADENGELSNKSTISTSGFYSLGGDVTITNMDYDFENAVLSGALHSGIIKIEHSNNTYKITSSNIKVLASSNEPSHIGMSFIGELAMYE